MKKKVQSHGCSNGDHHRASPRPGQAAYASVIVQFSGERTRWLGNSSQIESVLTLQSVQRMRAVCCCAAPSMWQASEAPAVGKPAWPRQETLTLKFRDNSDSS